MPKLKLDFSRKEQDALMKYAQRVRPFYKCVLLSACCACASAHHTLPFSRLFTHSLARSTSLTRSLVTFISLCRRSRRCT
jgi:hypothetical protein